MNEKPSIIKLVGCGFSALYFFMLTILIRLTFRSFMLRCHPYLRWVSAAHEARAEISFRLICALKDISPESYRAVQLYRLR